MACIQSLLFRLLKTSNKISYTDYPVINFIPGMASVLYRLTASAKVNSIRVPLGMPA